MTARGGLALIVGAAVLLLSFGRDAGAPPLPFVMDHGTPLSILGAEHDSRDALMVVLGELAFKSELLLDESPLTAVGIKPTCDTCHPDGGASQRIFFEGLSDKPGNIDVTNRAITLIEDGFFNPLNIPSVRGSRHTAPFARDGRFDSVHDFTLFAILNEFAGGYVSDVLMEALVVFQESLPFPDNPLLGPDGTLTTAASDSARRGERLFNRPFDGDPSRSCATCHVPGDYFLDHQIHDVGTGRDGKAGKAFETPTLLDTAQTAPYLHNGDLDTLAEAVDYFDGYFNAGFSAEDRANLTAYLEAIGGGTMPAPELDGELHTVTAADLLEITLGVEDWLSSKMVVQQSLIELHRWQGEPGVPSDDVVKQWMRHLRRIDGMVNGQDFASARDELGLFRQSIAAAGG